MLQDQTFGSRPILEVVAERYFFTLVWQRQRSRMTELLGTNESKKSKDYHAVKADSGRFAFRVSGNFDWKS